MVVCGVGGAVKCRKCCKSGACVCEGCIACVQSQYSV